MENLRKTAALLLAACVVVGGVAGGAGCAWLGGPSTDVTGTWEMAVETQAGTGNPSFNLVQDGNTVTGTYEGQLGEADVTGTVEDNQVTLQYEVSGLGQSLDVTYTGTVDGDTMTGEVNLGQLGSGTFTGTRAQ